LGVRLTEFKLHWIACDLRIDFAASFLGGLAAGMVLFIVSADSLSDGIMGFVNLAHGAFAMLGGYIIVLAMKVGARIRARARGGIHSSPPQ